jgi:hypothetical protein
LSFLILKSCQQDKLSLNKKDLTSILKESVAKGLIMRLFIVIYFMDENFISFDRQYCLEIKTMQNEGVFNFLCTLKRCTVQYM